MVGVPAWVCPSCQRRFGRLRQTHECAPAISLEEYLSTGPEHERLIAEAVLRHLETLGPVHVEPVSVGIFLKRSRTFAQLRPMDQWVALSFSLARRVQHGRITRKVVQYHGRFHHVANLRRPGDFDETLQGWLTEAYLDSGD